MPVELTNEQRVVRLGMRRIKRQAEALLEAVGQSRSVLSVLLTDDRRMALLHERWMGEEGPTDVMSFRMQEAGILGDVVISVETAARRRPGNPGAEVLRYLVHGLLHLMGHDHRRKVERLRMSRETRLLQNKVRAA